MSPVLFQLTAPVSLTCAFGDQGHVSAKDRNMGEGRTPPIRMGLGGGRLGMEALLLVSLSKWRSFFRFLRIRDF